MKLIYILCSLILLSCASQNSPTTTASTIDAATPEEKISIIEDNKKHIQWLSIQEAEELMEVKPKKMVIDIYTDWCGFCKKMDRSTLTKDEIIEYVNRHYYAVKLNAEGKDSIRFDNNTYGNDDRFHQFAQKLLSGRMGFPSFAYLNADKELITAIPGYRNDEEFIVDLHFIHEEHYKTTDYETFDAQYWKGKE